eukprot:TRINITY_DN82645_c0_g1_i1.p1 TRINITY_DN82645_c0_g1~~TRINITY_DN82645_c0_g1_i1.p1  ORF type:complete len:775 (+),score=150.45 TRINITY_DN82645_c0_g1_i1:25-2349(+)
MSFEEPFNASIDESFQFGDDCGITSTRLGGALAFVDSLHQRPQPQKHERWVDTKPQAFLDWSYRGTPFGLGRKGQTKNVLQNESLESHRQQQQSFRASSATPSTRAPSRAARSSPSPEMYLAQVEHREFVDEAAPMSARTQRASPQLQFPKIEKKGKTKKVMEVTDADSSMFENMGPLGSGKRWVFTHMGDKNAMSAWMQAAALADKQIGLDSPNMSLGSSQDWSTMKRKAATQGAVLQEGLTAAVETVSVRAQTVEVAMREKVATKIEEAEQLRRDIYLFDSAVASREALVNEADKADDDFLGECDSPGKGPSQYFQQNPLLAVSGIWAEGPEVSSDELLKELLGLRNGEEAVSLGKHRRKPVEVLANTVLGQMIQDDPDRAKKHGLVAVPAWSHNKPWPAPPITMRHFKNRAEQGNEECWNPQNENSSFAIAEDFPAFALKGRASVAPQGRKSQFEKQSSVGSDSIKRPSQSTPLRKSILPGKLDYLGGLQKKSARQSRLQNQTRERWSLNFSKVNARGSVVSVVKKDPLMTPGDESDLQSMGEASKNAEFTKILNGLDQTLKATWQNIFVKHSDTFPGLEHGVLRNPQSLRRAMLEAGIQVKTQQEQFRVREVQTEVIEFCREEHNNYEGPNRLLNPLTSRSGGWQIQEFVTMVAVLHEQKQKELLGADIAVADEFGVALDSILEYRYFFESYQVWNMTGRKKIFTVKELIRMLQDLEIKLAKQELCFILKDDKLDNRRELDFNQFVDVMVRLEDFLQAMSSENADQDVWE